MSYLPCKNTSCKSYGTPHPNCKCYGDMATGGDVSFCAKDQAHRPGCEYFADGGVAEKDDFFDEPQQPEEVSAPAHDDFFDEPKPPSQNSEAPAPERDDFFDSVTPKNQETSSYSLPSSMADAGKRLMGAGLFQTPSPSVDTGEKISPEDFQKAVKEKYSNEGQGLGIVTGGAAMAPMAEGISALAGLGALGTKALAGAVNSGAIQATDEVNKWAMGQGNPEHPVGAALANITAAGLFGLATGAAGYKSGVAGADEIKGLSNKAMSFMAGLGAYANPDKEKGLISALGNAELDKNAYNWGKKALSFLTVGPAVEEGIRGAKEGWQEGGLPGAIEQGVLKGGKAAAIAYATRKIAKPVIPYVMMKVMSNGGTQGILGAMSHMGDAAKGSSALSSAIEGSLGMASRAGQQTLNASPDVIKSFDDYLFHGGVTHGIKKTIQNQVNPEAQNFAKGGEVKRPEPKDDDMLRENNGVAIHYPEQNILMNAAKGRIFGYLSGLRPQENTPRLAFDDEPDQREAKKSYHQAISIANSPLGILDEVRKGTLEPDHVKHFNAMYPELNGLMQKRMTESLTKMQLDGKKPNYKTRQSLSMLMGTTLSSEMTPSNIQAAQAVFAAKQAQQGASSPGTGQGGSSQSPSKKSALSKSEQSFLTSGQALVRRQQATR